MEFESPDPAAASPPGSCLGGGGPPRTVLTNTGAGAVTARQERARLVALSPTGEEPVSWVGSVGGRRRLAQGRGRSASRRWRPARYSGLGSATPAWAPRRLPSSDQAGLTTSRTSWPSSTSASTAMIWRASSSDNSTPAHGPGPTAPSAVSFRCPPSGRPSLAAQDIGPGWPVAGGIEIARLTGLDNCYCLSNTSSSIGGVEWGRTVPSAGPSPAPSVRSRACSRC